jgi:hypothetical protein
MKLLSIFSILIFLIGCQSTVNNQNNIKKEKLNFLKNKIKEQNNSKKQLNISIEEEKSNIMNQLNKCKKKINYFNNKTNNYFTKNIFLYNLKQLETISIYYKNEINKLKMKSIKPIQYIFEDDFLVISENKQYNSLNYKGFKLDNPSSIYFLNIEYIDKNDKHQYKHICIDVENRNIENNNLFLYENRYYFHDMIVKHKKQHKVKPKLIFKEIPSNHALKILYSEDDKYFYIKILGCKNNQVCKEPKYIQQPNDKIIVFRFSLMGNHTQKIENFYSQYIKRIEIGFQGEIKKDNNHLVIESKNKKITNITKVDFNQGKSKNKELIYKIEF